MPLFSSSKERWLWMWTLAVLLTIYATLGPALTIAEALRERNVLEVFVLTIALLLGGGVLLAWIRRRPGWREIGLALGIGFAFLMVGARIQSWEERTHLIEYGVIAALVHQALLERKRNGRQVWAPAALAIIVTSILGALDELIQLFLPERVFDWRDIFFNFFAAFMVTAARLAIEPQRKPGWRLWFLWLMATSIGWGWGIYWGWYDGTEPKMMQAVPASMLAGFFGLVTGCLTMGILQALVLWRHINKAYRWFVTYLAALGVAGIFVFGLGRVDVQLGWQVTVLSLGTVLGIFQWLAVRGQVQGAVWWIPLSAIGWLISIPAGDINGPPGLGGLYGVITATMMVWLLRKQAGSGAA